METSASQPEQFENPLKIEVVQAADTQTLRDAARVIGEAFMTGNADQPDPLYDRDPIRDDMERALPLFFSIVQSAAQKGHEITVVRDEDAKVIGAAWVKPAGVEDISTVNFAKVLAGSAIKALGLGGAIRYGIDSMRHLKVHPPEETYISMVGVDKDTRGKGVGKALIMNAIDKANGERVVLSTMDSANVERYKRWGLKL